MAGYHCKRPSSSGVLAAALDPAEFTYWTPMPSFDMGVYSDARVGTHVGSTVSGVRTRPGWRMEAAFTLPDCDDCVYTSCYCEENIYWLVERFLSAPAHDGRWDVFAVFISNPTRTVALWNQRMGSSKDTPVVWDYHVILALRGRAYSQSSNCHRTSECGTWIYDLDTHLPVPCHWKTYVDQTFPLGDDIPLQYRSFFRVIPGNVYLDNFASDRSHMLDGSLSNGSEEPRYLSKPPPYAAICGPEARKHGVGHNLVTHFVSMGDEPGFGAVMELGAFASWCGRVT